MSEHTTPWDWVDAIDLEEKPRVLKRVGPTWQTFLNALEQVYPNIFQHCANTITPISELYQKFSPFAWASQSTPDTTYPEELIAGHRYAMVTPEYAEQVRKMVPLARRLFIETSVAHSSQTLQTALLALRKAAAPSKRLMWTTTSVISAFSRSTLDAWLRVVEIYNSLYADRPLAIPKIAETQLNQTPFFADIPDIKPSFKPRLGNLVQPNVRHYTYLHPDARPICFERSAELLNQLATLHNVQRTQGLNSVEQNEANDILAELAWRWATLAPFDPPGNWSIFFVVLDVWREALGLERVPSTSLDIMLMLTKTLEDAKGVYRAMTRPETEGVRLIDIVYEPDAAAGCLLRYTDRNKAPAYLVCPDMD